ncbi:MAG: glycosyltransferase family protein [Anaerolineales bacterium]|nr:glycosyltransferase family protein [Chloroflexota bacterium]MBL6979867.1 glycosyltransferase family protein [Anaerolineales bacterium]
MNIIAIIQARMSASRLPSKVLLDIAGRPMLQWVVERTRKARTISQVVVATTTDPSDDTVVDFCRSQNIAYSRGSIHDVLDRYYQAAKEFKADVVVRITADCPFIDPELLDQAVCGLFTSPSEVIDSDHCPLTTVHWDFVTNRLPKPWWRSYPIGLDTEVFTFVALEQAWQQAKELHQREHVTPYFYEGVPVEDLQFSSDKIPLGKSISPLGFKVGLLHHDEELGHHRWTVDTPEDLAFVREVASRLPKDQFAWLDVLALLEREPEIMQINADIQHKTHLDVDDRQR